MSTRPTNAERALLAQVAESREISRLAMGYRSGDLEGAPSASPSVHELVRAQAAVSRLTMQYELRRAARLAGAERDPLRRLQRLRDLAEQDGSWGPAARLGAEARALAKELEEKDRAAADAEHRRNLTPEERAAMLAGLVDSASDGELEVCVSEWLRRRRYRLVVDDGGTLQLIPLGELGLKLVGE